MSKGGEGGEGRGGEEKGGQGRGISPPYARFYIQNIFGLTPLSTVTVMPRYSIVPAHKRGRRVHSRRG